MMKKLHFCSARCLLLAAVVMTLGASATLALSGCEKPVWDEPDNSKGDGGQANVTLTFTPYSQESFATRAASALSDQLARLQVTIFKADGSKVKTVAQKASDADFGRVRLSLAEGTYKVVAIAHNGEGNATLTSPEKVTFASNKVTDTFSYCGTLTVGEDAVSQELTLQRVVAMVRLTLSEPLPEDITRIKFYYTGGSSTLNPSTGYGCVNSKQTEYRNTADDEGLAVSTYELYTMPHEKNDVLKIVITALGEDGSELQERTFDDVPVTTNKITTWQGTLFGGSGTSGDTQQGGFTVSLDTDWSGTISYTF